MMVPAGCLILVVSTLVALVGVWLDSDKTTRRGQTGMVLGGLLIAIGLIV